MHSINVGTLGRSELDLPWLSVPPVLGATLAQVADSAREFFNAPENVKVLNTLEYECGYRRLGIEYSVSADRPDQIESFTVSPHVVPVGEELPSSSARLLHSQMLSVFQQLEPIVESIAITWANRVSGNDWAETLKGGLKRWSRLQVNFSRPALSTGTNIHDSHEDGNLLTLACATEIGLEVQRADGLFVSVPASLDNMLIMPGEIAWLLSAGEIQPLWHRVVPKHRITERIAILFFADIDPQLCQPWVRGDVNTGINIGERVLNNGERFGLAKYTLDEAIPEPTQVNKASKTSASQVATP
jgi:hypothetical protein